MKNKRFLLGWVAMSLWLTARAKQISCSIIPVMLPKVWLPEYLQ